MNNTITFEEIENLIKTNNLHYYNIFNADIPTTTQYTSKYYLTHDYDTIDIDQKLNIQSNDIEVFTYNQGIDSITDAKYPINIVSTCNTVDKIVHVYILFLEDTFQKFGLSMDADFKYDEFCIERQNYYKQELIKLGYIGNKFIDDTYEIKLYSYLNEKDLLLDYWNQVHTYDPDVLTGWNSDGFDFPYIYSRLIQLFGNEDAKKIISKFETVEFRNGKVQIFDYAIADLMYLYKPRDEGGLNYGKKNFSYSLDNISLSELKLQKIEYKDSNLTLDDFYLNDPINAVLYNIVDTLLVCALNEKLQHIVLHNLLRRLMATPFHSSMVGSSALFEHFIFYNLTKDNKVIRYGINSELSRSIEAEELQSFPPIRNKKGATLKINKIPARGSKTSYSSIINKFPGAWVKDPDSKIINDGSIIIDLDATALYPSMILQSNISFDSYQARIIPPACYKTLSILETHLGRGSFPLAQLSTALATMIFSYVDREQESSKEELSTNIYYILLYLFNRLELTKIKYDNLLQPTNTKESIALKTILVPILDIMNTIHPDSEKYNNFAYDKVFLPYPDLKIKYPHIYILHHPNEANSYIKKYPLDEGISFIQTKAMSFAGTLFSKHDEKMGLFADFLQRMKNMRNTYKNKAKEYSPGSIEHNYNDARQKTVKIVMNTTYGLYGLSTFRYSNHWLARSITNNGLITIKAAQYMSEEFLKAYFK